MVEKEYFVLIDIRHYILDTLKSNLKSNEQDKFQHRQNQMSNIWSKSNMFNGRSFYNSIYGQSKAYNKMLTSEHPKPKTLKELKGVQCHTDKNTCKPRVCCGIVLRFDTPMTEITAVQPCVAIDAIRLSKLGVC